jgi:pyridoxal phosphate enzyme (YggS family)
MTHSTITLEHRIAAVTRQLDQAADRARRDPASITITAVSKTVDRQTMLEAYDLGLRHFGENRVQDARTKLAEPMPSDATLHLIGQLQTNKAHHAVQLFQIIESVDRPSLIQELEKQASRHGIVLPVLLQVNIAGEEQKAGCEPEAAASLARQVGQADHLRLDGLMTMAPLVDDAEDVRSVFRGLRELRDQLQDTLSAALPVLSMGMTNDYTVAIEEGATHIRVGRAIFG